jgi:hypothetical protein
MAAWTPTELGTAVKAWWKADAITPQADGTALSSWPDSSGNSRTLVQATGGVQPTYETNELNSLPVVRFASASSQRLEIANTLGMTTAPFHIFAVWKPADQANGALIAFESGGANDAAVYISATKTLAMYMNGEYGVAITLAAWRMTSSILVDNAGTHSIDGNTRTTGDPNSTTMNGTKTVVGANAAESSLFLNGDIAEIVVASAATTQADEDKLFGYVAHKYGLTASLPALHPYKSSAPQIGNRTGLRYRIADGLRQRTLR